MAHNPAGAWALRSGFNAVFGQRTPRILVFGCLRDKPLPEMAQILFTEFDRVIFAPINSPRAVSLESLLEAARSLGTDAEAADSVDEALKLATRQGLGGVVVISGSVYLVGEARAILLRERGQQT